MMRPPWILGSWGEWLFIFRELGGTDYYFRGAGEKSHTFGNFESIAKHLRKHKFRHFGSYEPLFVGIEGAQTPPLEASIMCSAAVSKTISADHANYIKTICVLML